MLPTARAVRTNKRIKLRLPVAGLLLEALPSKVKMGLEFSPDMVANKLLLTPRFKTKLSPRQLASNGTVEEYTS